MPTDFRSIQNEDNLKGASALVEVAAMARVGVLSAGAKVTGQRASQMERDAKRQERRGKTGRATELKSAAASLKSVKLSMSVQGEKEQIRPLVPMDDTALVQGRTSKDGVGKAGLTVSLVDDNGKVLDRTRSAENGSFVLKQATAVTGTWIVVADVDGTDLGTLKAPRVKRAGSVFLDMPVERLDLGAVRPKADQPEVDGLIMPRVLGQTFENAVETLEKDFAMGTVKLERVAGKAGIVLEQSPAPDSKVKPGTAVDLLVGTGNKAKDLRTVRALIRLDPDIIAAKISPRNLTTAEKAAKIKTLPNLAKLPEMATAQVAELLPEANEEQAKVWQAAIKRVLARFPGN